MSTLAILGGSPVRTAPFPKWPQPTEEEEECLREALYSGVWGIGSLLIETFEKKWADYVGTRYALTCTNGTDALYIAVKAAGLRVGEEVIVPPYTFIATASSVMLANGVPVFVDIQPDTYNLDPTAIEAAITERTRAIIPVHIGGRPADMDAILEVARRHDLIVIEDCAQAHGAIWRGRKVGSLGDMGCFSFQSSKNLTAGEGGAITTNEERFWSLCFSFKNVGRVPEGGWYEHRVLGSNHRMTAFQAAVLLAGLERLDEQTDRRHANGQYLDSQLSQIEGLETMAPDPRVERNAYHLYIFKYKAEEWGGVSRETFLRALRAEGIPASSGYVPLYRQEAFVVDAQRMPQFQGKEVPYAKMSLPVCEQAAREGVWLFQSLLLGTRKDMDDIVEAIAKLRRHLDELRRVEG